MRFQSIHRWAFAAFAALALTGCGADDEPGAPWAGGPPALEAGDVTDLPGQGTPTAATTAPARPWPAPCKLFTEADVLAATDHQHTTITVVDREEEDTSLGDTRVGRCGYNTKGVELTDGTRAESTGDNWVRMEVRDSGASFMFPPEAGSEKVSGVGDAAYWNDPGNTILHVQKGDWVLTFESYAPTDSADLADVTGGRRTVTVNVAKLVLARLTP